MLITVNNRNTIAKEYGAKLPVAILKTKNYEHSDKTVKSKLKSREETLRPKDETFKQETKDLNLEKEPDSGMAPVEKSSRQTMSIRAGKTTTKILSEQPDTGKIPEGRTLSHRKKSGTLSHRKKTRFSMPRSNRSFRATSGGYSYAEFVKNMKLRIPNDFDDDGETFDETCDRVLADWEERKRKQGNGHSIWWKRSRYLEKKGLKERYVPQKKK